MQGPMYQKLDGLDNNFAIYTTQMIWNLSRTIFYEHAVRVIHLLRPDDSFVRQ